MKNGFTGLGQVLRTAGCMAAALALAGCASIPDVTVSYRPVKWSVQVATAHTVTCTDDSKHYMVAAGATYVPVYSADIEPGTDPLEIKLKKMDRFYADVDFTISLTDDGRLKSINQSTTGQGEAITKAFVGVVTAISALPMLETVKPTPPQPSVICPIVREWSIPAKDQLRQVSLTQNGRAAQEGTVKMEVPEEQKGLFARLKKAGLDLTATVSAELKDGKLQPVSKPKPTSSVADDEVAVTLQQIGPLEFTAEDARGEKLGGKRIPVPLRNKDGKYEYFVLPIPKAALFGKQTFQVTVAESGRITSLGYGSTSGAAGLLGAASAVAGEPVSEDNARAAAAKASADLIAQQARLNSCLLKPAECPK